MAVRYDCWVFECKKCGHLIFIDKTENLKKMFKCRCPECGEEPLRNWVLVGEGNGKTFNWKIGE